MTWTLLCSHNALFYIVPMTSSQPTQRNSSSSQQRISDLFDHYYPFLLHLFHSLWLEFFGTTVDCRETSHWVNQNRLDSYKEIPLLLHSACWGQGASEVSKGTLARLYAVVAIVVSFVDLSLFISYFPIPLCHKKRVSSMTPASKCRTP